MATQGRRRAYGQHFLKDQAMARKIAEAALDAARKSEARALLEIGPGRGAITEPIFTILETAPGLEKWVICEKDRALGQHWVEVATKHVGIPVKVAVSDFLELEESRWLVEVPLVVVSNLPYSSGTAILNRLAKHPEKIPAMVLMFQAEVAQRLRAEPNSKAWGSLSVAIQNRWEVKKLATVPPGAFSPPPEVQSEVVTLRARPEPLVPGTSESAREAAFQSLVKACFAHRRKMLRSSLASLGPYQIALEQSGIDGRKRAEALDWEEWRRLFRALP